VTLLFVYGTLKRGFGNNRFLDGQKFMGNAVSTEPHYFMTGDGIPYLHEDDQNGKFVVGEIWEVSDAALEAIDGLEGHPNHYCREERLFFCKGKPIVAWVYLAAMMWTERERYQGSVLHWPPLEEIAHDERVGLDPTHVSGRNGDKDVFETE
jgi:gamma-glutamylcyclotransferase (GGCT)/AIG2-like uncharacterized protein YtfP